jgi:hypothetical protein
LDQVAQEARHPANSAVAAAPVSRWHRGTRTWTILRAIDFIVKMVAVNEMLSYSNDGGQPASEIDQLFRSFCTVAENVATPPQKRSKIMHK